MTVEPIEAPQATEPTIPPGPHWDQDQERKRCEYIAGRANGFVSAALRIAFDSLGHMVQESDEALRKRNPHDAPTMTRDIISTAQTAIRVLAGEAAIVPNDDGSFRIAYGGQTTNLASPAPESPTP